MNETLYNYKIIKMIQDYIIYEGEIFKKYKFDFNTNTVIGKRNKKPLTLTLGPTGYYRVNLESDDSTKKDRKNVFSQYHRVVYQQYYPNDDIKGDGMFNKIEIDHIDRNPINNDISNLRSVTNCQNQANKNKCVKPTTSKYIGISYCKRDGREPRWDSSINVETNRYRKFFKSEFEALKWRNNKIIELGVQEYYEIQPWIKKQVVIKKKN